MARPFPYGADRAKASVETGKDDQGQRAYIEITSEKFVNIGFDAVSVGGDPNLRQGWTSIARGPMLDDLIVALTYYQQEGYKL